MAQPSTNIVDALSGEEVCPLCFDRYSEADACSCVVCRVSSCPSCAEVLDADGAVRCFACRPAQLAARASSEGVAPLSLPRPIALPNAARTYTPGLGAAALPALPFPLTTSPHGVRKLERKPPGSVFVGLPAVAAGLAQSLREQAKQTQPEQVGEARPKLARRSQQKLVLLARGIDALARLVSLSQRLVAFARGPEVHAFRQQARAQLAVVQAAGVRKLRGLASAALLHGRAFAAWCEHALEPRVRALVLRLARHGVRPKPTSVRVDPSRPIHL